jgi:hypothetical protein
MRWCTTYLPSKFELNTNAYMPTNSRRSVQVRPSLSFPQLSKPPPAESPPPSSLLQHPSPYSTKSKSAAVAVGASSNLAQQASHVSTTRTSIRSVDSSVIARVFACRRSSVAVLQASSVRSLDKCAWTILGMIAVRRRAVRIVEGCAFGLPLSERRRRGGFVGANGPPIFAGVLHLTCI